MTYDSDAANTQLTNSSWYLDSGDMLSCVPTAAQTDPTNKGFITRLHRIKQSKEVHLYGRLHSGISNVPIYLFPDLRIQIKLTKALSRFYLMSKTADSKTTFKFLDAKLYVKRVRSNPAILLAHHSTLNKGSIARYNMTRVELKSFTFSSGSKSVSIYNSVLGPSPKSFVQYVKKHRFSRLFGHQQKQFSTLWSQ